MEQHHYHSKARVRRLIGFLDFLLTVALIVYIILFTITPLLQEKEASRFKSGQGTANPHQVGELSEKWWMYPFLGLCCIFGIIPIVAAFALLISSSSSIDFERAQSQIRFWMYCNSCTVIAASVVLLGTFLLDLLVVRVGSAAPTLAYLVIRAIFTYIIWKQLNTLSPPLRATMEDDLLEEKRARYREISKLPALERQSQSELCATIMLPSELPLRPYHGGNGVAVVGGSGLSMPNCHQCCSSQNCYQ